MSPDAARLAATVGPFPEATGLHVFTLATGAERRWDGPRVGPRLRPRRRARLPVAGRGRPYPGADHLRGPVAGPRGPAAGHRGARQQPAGRQPAGPAHTDRPGKLVRQLLAPGPDQRRRPGHHRRHPGRSAPRERAHARRHPETPHLLGHDRHTAARAQPPTRPRRLRARPVGQPVRTAADRHRHPARPHRRHLQPRAQRRYPQPGPLHPIPWSTRTFAAAW